MIRWIQELAATYKGDFYLDESMPQGGERNPWETISPIYRQQLIEAGEAYLEYDWPQLTATMYLRFSIDGNRDVFTTTYFARRHALNTLVVAECIEDCGRFYQDIANGIMLICEESSWTPPEHNTYERDQKGPAMPDVQRPVLDLFSCETGANLALIGYLLGGRLDDISPLINERIRYELDKRIIRPYLSEHFWWMGRDDEPMNNWTIWCTQNVLHVMTLSTWSSDITRGVYDKAVQSIDYFLEAYEEDGCCDEGAIYYRKAGLCLFTAVTTLNHMTHNHFESVWSRDKIKKMADYIRMVHVDSKYYMNFADCSAVPGAAGSGEYLFGIATDNEKLESYALWSRFNEGRHIKDTPSLYDHVRDVLYYDEMYSRHAGAVVNHEDIYYPSVGLAIVRDSIYCLGVKAGDNDDSHNHNDVGSYILYQNGEPFIVDIGVETYTGKTFSQERYDIWTMQSQYHNLPTINGVMQKAGSQYRAENVRMDNDHRLFLMSMDISSAYPEEARIKSFNRAIEFVKEKTITIVDSFTPSKGDGHEIISHMILYHEPRICGTQLIFDNGSMIVLSGDISQITCECLPITDARLKWAWDKDLFRVCISWKGRSLVTYFTH